MWRPVSWFAMRMSCLVSTWYGFLLRIFFILVGFIITFNYRFSCVKKYNCLLVSSEISFVRDSFSCGVRLVTKPCGLIEWFLYGASYCTEGLLKNLSESFINNLCIRICNISQLKIPNTLQFYQIPPNNMSSILWKNIWTFCNLLFFYLFPLRSCL